jgi:hypothetical protein
MTLPWMMTTDSEHSPCCRVQRVSSPEDRLYAVQATVGVVVGYAASAGLDVRISEHPHPAELARRSSTMPGCQQNRRGQQCSATAKGGRSIHFH